jgi:hypothetical protein
MSRKLEAWRERLVRDFGRQAPHLDFSRLSLNELLVLLCFVCTSDLPLTEAQRWELGAIADKISREPARAS